MTHRTLREGTLESQGKTTWFGFHPCAVGLFGLAVIGVIASALTPGA